MIVDRRSLSSKVIEGKSTNVVAPKMFYNEIEDR
jgi:hypothetical protein